MQTFLTDPRNILRSIDIVWQVFAKASLAHDGLFPAVAERQNGNILMDFPMPAPIPGQRNSDRSPRGNNLQHDIPLLAALDGMSQAYDRERYQILRTNYLQTYAKTVAPASPTGLLPWGEHAYWDLNLGRIGNSYILQYGEQPLDAGIETHHQMSMLPIADWKVIHESNPTVLPRFVDGLNWHWDDEERTKFNRHAPITQFVRGYQIKRHAKITKTDPKDHNGSDFPGSAGLFVHDYACALALVDQPRGEWLDELHAFCDSWWDRRLENGLLPKSGGKSKLAWNGASIGQTMSFAHALAEASKVLTESHPELSATLMQRAQSFAKAIVATEQPALDDGAFCLSYNEDGSPFQTTQAWAGNRGTGTTAKTLGLLLNLLQKTNTSDGIDIVTRAMATYRDSMIPRDTIVRAGDPGAVIGVLGELFRLTQDEMWYDMAMAHATDAMELFFDSPLPRMAIGRSHYEAQQGSSVLIHSMGRLVAIAENKPCVGGFAHIFH